MIRYNDFCVWDLFLIKDRIKEENIHIKYLLLREYVVLSVFFYYETKQNNDQGLCSFFEEVCRFTSHQGGGKWGGESMGVHLSPETPVTLGRVRWGPGLLI